MADLLRSSLKPLLTPFNRSIFGGGATNFRVQFSIDLTWMTGNVTGWVARIYAEDLPANFFSFASATNNLLFRDDSLTLLDSAVTTFDAGTGEFTAYVQIDTTSGVTNTFYMDYGEDIDHTHTGSSIFSDYEIVQDVLHDHTQSVTGDAATAGSTAGFPTDNTSFDSDAFYYWELDAAASTRLTTLGSLTAVMSINSGTWQGDTLGFISGATTSRFYGLTIGDAGQDAQSFSSVNGWVNTEGSGSNLTAGQVYGHTAYYDDTTANRRYVLLDGVNDNDEAVSTHSGMTRFVVGNLLDRTSFGFRGTLYEIRASSTINSLDHQLLDSYGLVQGRIVAGTPEALEV